MVLKDQLLDLVKRSDGGSISSESYANVEGVLASCTVEDVRYFTDSFYPTHPALAARWLESCGWSMLDQVFSLAMLCVLSDEDICRVQKLFPLLARHTNARELYIIIMGKFSDALTSSAFVVLSGALFQSIVHILRPKDLVHMVETGCCRSVVRTLRHVIRTDQRPQKGDVDHAHKACDHLLSMSWYLVGHVVQCRRVQRELSAEAYAVVAFLLNVAGKCVVLLCDRCVRRLLFLRILAQLAVVLDGDLHCLFKEIYRCRHQRFEADRECALKQQQHRSSHLHATDDMQAVPLNRVSQAPYSALLMHYFDAFDFSEETYSTGHVHWVNSVSWHGATSEQQQQGVGERGDGHATSWELRSIALMAHSFLQHLTTSRSPGSDPSVGAPTVPLIYRADYWKAFLYPYVLQLMSSRGASASWDDVRTHEGLEFSTALLLGCSHAVDSRPLFLPLFVPALLPPPTAVTNTPQATAAEGSSAMSHIWLSFYRGLPACDSRVEGRGGGSNKTTSFWTALDAAKLAFLSATASDILFMCQSMITAMSACDDAQLRTQSFAAFRSLLRRVEERSLFGLLCVLISSCPFPNIAGLLIDVARECSQVASRLDSDASSASWCSSRYTAHLSAGTADPPWLLQLHGSPDNASPPSTDTKPPFFPVHKLFQPTVSTINGETSSMPDIALVPLVPSPQYSAAEMSAAGMSEHRLTVADRFIALPHMTDVVPFAQHVELQEAAPFLWHGVSPFWSPLVITYFVLDPLRSAASYGEQEIMDKIDFLAAVFNALKFVVMRLSTDCPDTQSRIVDAYFSGTALSADCSPADCYTHSSCLLAEHIPYTLNKLSCVRELFEANELARRCSARIDSMLSSTSISSSPQQLQLQLLSNNASHLVEKCHYVCSAMQAVLCGRIPSLAHFRSVLQR